MALCLVKHRDNFTCILRAYKCMMYVTHGRHTQLDENEISMKIKSLMGVC
jgi:hypothetical protein